MFSRFSSLLSAVLLLTFATTTPTAWADPFVQQILEELREVGEGTSLLGETENQALKRWRGRYPRSVSIETVQDQPFTQAMRLHTASKRDKYFDDGASTRLPTSLQKGDWVYLTLSARSLESAAESGEAVAYFVIKGKEKGKGEFRRYFAVGQDWQRFQWRFKAKRDYARNQLEMYLWTGDQAQTMQVGGLAMIRFGPDANTQAIPKTKLNLDYPGREPDAEWREAANQRIEQLRKGQLTVHVTDPQGNPVPNVTVTFQQTRHAFAFGVAIKGHKFVDDPAYAAVVDRIIDVGGLSSVVLENDLKPGLWRGSGPMNSKKHSKPLTNSSSATCASGATPSSGAHATSADHKNRHSKRKTPINSRLLCSPISLIVPAKPLPISMPGMSTMNTSPTAA